MTILAVMTSGFTRCCLSSFFCVFEQISDASKTFNYCFVHISVQIGNLLSIAKTNTCKGRAESAVLTRPSDQITVQLLKIYIWEEFNKGVYNGAGCEIVVDNCCGCTAALVKIFESPNLGCDSVFRFLQLVYHIQSCGSCDVEQNG